MQKLLVVFLFVLSLMTGWANNIKINSEAKIVGFTGAAQDTALVEFSVTWDNSWRDDFNWDAAWIFLKYKKRGLNTEWQHAYLTREGHTAQPQSGNEGGNYMFMFGEIGTGNDAKVTGVYLIRDGIADGQVNATVQVKWPIAANTRMPLTVSDFGADRDSVYVAAYAIEMVYVPYGEYRLGDGHSYNSFLVKETDFYGVIPEEADVVTTDYTITANNWGEGSHPSNVAKRVNNAPYAPSNNSWYASGTPSWWSIDFGSPKKILFFGISVSTSYPSNYNPQATWRFEGSNDNTNWTVLSYIDRSLWKAESISYPVQHSIRVSNPGNYRYYRFYFPSSNIIIQNIAMTEKNLFSVSEGGGVKVSSENQLGFVNNDLTLPAAYPKGFRGFYAMKYEVSQEQYVEFLNSLTLTQQKNRVMNSDFEHMSKGDYVFGDVKRPNCRNGIAFLMQKGEGAPALFGNNLNADNKFYLEDDGQTLACNYLSPADMLAYCDWSGLRPMSELEYEKSCRRPSPQIPEKGEYAWNSNSGVNRLRTLSDLTGAQTERETPFDYKINVNAGNKINGPVRSGAFATSRTGQLEAGATYWGLMEMSGNLWELCYNATAAGSVFKGDNVSYSHGDGLLNTDGSTNIGASYWPSAVAAFGVRGGSFVSADSLLRTSDRTYAGGNYFSALTQRDSSVGFRGVRSVLNTTGFTAGRIYCANGLEQDTVCSEKEFTIIGEPAEKAVGKTIYSWYVSEDNGTTWTMLENHVGLSLTYESVKNSTTATKVYLFKRKVSCAVGEIFTDQVKIVIPAIFAAPALEDDAVIAVVGQTVQLTMPSGPSGVLYSWIHPDGRITNSATLTLSSFSLDDAGVYYATYSGGRCEGAKKAIEIYPYEEMGKQAFYYKGSEEIATVPVGATHVRAYLIGASGGLGSYSNGLSSGAGGYTDALFPVVNISAIGVIVGQHGTYAAKGVRTTAAYPNGGMGQGGDVAPGGGGGRSQVRDYSKNVLVAIAGGGGGCNGYSGNGGAGGGLVGQSGGGYITTTGGTQTAGGGPVAGGYLQGAHASTNTGYDCGGGGDGYYGGGTANGDGQPAGGGSGYINRDICIMGKTYTGNYAARPTEVATTIVGYSTNNYGKGVTGQYLNGNDGMVVLQYLKRLTK